MSGLSSKAHHLRDCSASTVKHSPTTPLICTRTIALRLPASERHVDEPPARAYVDEPAECPD
jgi:hypothetical protein